MPGFLGVGDSVCLPPDSIYGLELISLSPSVSVPWGLLITVHLLSGAPLLSSLKEPTSLPDFSKAQTMIHKTRYVFWQKPYYFTDMPALQPGLFWA